MMSMEIVVVIIAALAAVLLYLLMVAKRRESQLMAEIAQLRERQDGWSLRLQQAEKQASESVQQAERMAEQRINDVRSQAEHDKAQLTATLKAEAELSREQQRLQFQTNMEQRTHQLQDEAQQRMRLIKTEAEERMNMLRQTNAEQMSKIVEPLQQELEHLRKLVNTSHESQLKNTSTLEASIKAVFEHDKERDKTTQSLAEALKNRGKVQGDWGEQVLENILRDSGLREGEEYVKQTNVKTEEGRNDRPDVIVYGADGSAIIIDSKVSLTAYTDYVGASDDEERIAAQRANYDSIWKHVCELSDKSYHREVEHAMPIVLMFVPNEGSYILAMNKDPQLGAKAYRKGVLIINPTNLMVVLRLMFLTWQNVRIDKNNRHIMEAAGKIYDKYTVFAKNFVQIGSQLSTVRSTYDDAMKQLREGNGNLSRQMEKLLQYGATATKQLPKGAEPLDVE